jgi:hypothetical protein
MIERDKELRSWRCVWRASAIMLEGREEGDGQVILALYPLLLHVSFQSE